MPAKRNLASVYYDVASIELRQKFLFRSCSYGKTAPAAGAVNTALLLLSLLFSTILRIRRELRKDINARIDDFSVES